MPQPKSTPTAAGITAPTVGITLPMVAPLPKCTSGITATHLWIKGKLATLATCCLAPASNATPRVQDFTVGHLIRFDLLMSFLRNICQSKLYFASQNRPVKIKGILMFMVGWIVAIFLILNLIFQQRHLRREDIQIAKPQPRKGSETSLSNPRIGYMKTHKTGSTTLQNILLRYALKQDRVLAMPPECEWRLFGTEGGWNASFQVDILDPNPWHKSYLEQQRYEMCLFHSRWNKEQYRKLLGPNAIFVTILRNPADQFESQYEFFKLQYTFKLTLSQYIE
eukprot:maker-scaffold1676_size31565-snap-gene-0.11 protein:Tk09403 transcript:maker-scaffold1676_size31565-snap-gene-0.11-mRNA-1 annotation:"unnamed protein product"